MTLCAGAFIMRTLAQYGCYLRCFVYVYTRPLASGFEESKVSCIWGSLASFILNREFEEVPWIPTATCARVGPQKGTVD